MPEVRPFVGLLYDPATAGPLGMLVAPPYDVISPAEQERFYRASPYNVIRLILGRRESGDDRPEEPVYAGRFLPPNVARRRDPSGHPGALAVPVRVDLSRRRPAPPAPRGGRRGGPRGMGRLHPAARAHLPQPVGGSAPAPQGRPGQPVARLRDRPRTGGRDAPVAGDRHGPPRPRRVLRRVGHPPPPVCDLTPHRASLRRPGRPAADDRRRPPPVLGRPGLSG